MLPAIEEIGPTHYANNSTEAASAATVMNEKVDEDAEFGTSLPGAPDSEMSKLTVRTLLIKPAITLASLASTCVGAVELSTNNVMVHGPVPKFGFPTCHSAQIPFS